MILSRFIENSLDFDGCIEATFRELQQKRLDSSIISLLDRPTRV